MKESTKKNLPAYCLVASLIIAADRLSKHYVMQAQSLPNFLCLNLEPSLNRGLSWSLFSSQTTSIFIGVSCIALAFFSFFFLYTFRRYKQNFSIWGEVFIIAGALSNLIDRLLYQGVVDFITIWCGPWAWPSFNIADVAICLGAGLIAIHIFRE